MTLRPLLILALLAAVLTVPATATAATSAAKTVDIGDGVTLGYRTAGSGGTPLVLITGSAVTMAEWDPAFVSALAKNRRVILFDNRGMGWSTGPVEGLTIGRMAADTAQLIRKLKLGRPDVLGWSMGGYIAQELALNYPGHVRRLVLASTDPGSQRTKPPSAATLKVLTNPGTTPQQLLSILFPPDAQAAGNAWLGRIGSQPALSAEDFTTPAATVEAQDRACGPDWIARGKGTYAELPKLRKLTMVAYGAEDVIVPPSNARLMASRLPHVVVRRAANAGHAFMFQRPAATATAFTRFLDAR